MLDHVQYNISGYLPRELQTGCSEEREEDRRPQLKTLAGLEQRVYTIEHTAAVLVHLWLGLDERHLASASASAYASTMTGNKLMDRILILVRTAL